MDATETVGSRLQTVRDRISQAEQRFTRTPGSVGLVAVSKTVPAERIYSAFCDYKQARFGENYLQEALTKISDVRLRNEPLEWHFIGALQTNKTTKIAAYFDWVHTVDSLAIARHLSDQRAPHLSALNICLQVNLSEEVNKAGCSLAQLPGLATSVARLPRLRLRGLMTLAKPSADFAQQRLPFRALREALEQLRSGGLELDTLSMGMSQDLEAAIAEGTTLVRVGTAIFGSRKA